VRVTVLVAVAADQLGVRLRPWVDLSKPLDVHIGVARAHHEYASLLRKMPTAFPELDIRELDKQPMRIALNTDAAAQ
jgi:hypothetical protein